MDLGCDPEAEALVDDTGLGDGVEDLLTEVQVEVAVLQQEPPPCNHGLRHEPTGVGLLTLAHRYELDLWGRRETH